MVTMTQSAANRHTQAFTHTLTSAQLQPRLFEAPAQLLRNLESIFYFEGTWGKAGGSKPECPEKTPDSLPADRYHTLEEKIQRPERESNPHPPTLVISSPAQEHAPRLTHWATDRRVHNVQSSNRTLYYAKFTNKHAYTGYSWCHPILRDNPDTNQTLSQFAQHQKNVDNNDR